MSASYRHAAFFDRFDACSDGCRVTSEPERQELCGATLEGRYRVVKRIGVGGTGVVFEAVCLRDGTSVAIKTLRPCFVTHPDLGHRLRREAEVARRVRHPSVVPVFDEGCLEDGSPFLVMPLLQGESVSRLLLRHRELPVNVVALLASRVAAVLHSSHCVGYVHRDVKPEHVLLNRSPGGELTLHLLDYGVCSSAMASAAERRRERGKVFGTPSYVSPEQAAGQVDVDGRADLFSLGVVMFEMLAGRLPFRGATVPKLLVRIIREDAPRVRDVLPGVDPTMDAIVHRLLGREPHRRFPSARALSRALLPLTGDRRETERRIAASLNTTSQVADTAPTERCSTPGEVAKPTRRVA